MFLPLLSGKVKTGGFVLVCEQRFLPSNLHVRRTDQVFYLLWKNAHSSQMQGQITVSCLSWLIPELSVSCGSCWYLRPSTSKHGSSLLSLPSSCRWSDWNNKAEMFLRLYCVLQTNMLSLLRSLFPLWLTCSLKWPVFSQWSTVTSLNFSHFIGPFSHQFSSLIPTGSRAIHCSLALAPISID